VNLTHSDLRLIIEALDAARETYAGMWDRCRNDWDAEKSQAPLREQVQAMGLLQERLCKDIGWELPDLQYDDDGHPLPLTLPQHREG
jgi:hypothetical protein